MVNMADRDGSLQKERADDANGELLEDTMFDDFAIKSAEERVSPLLGQLYRGVLSAYRIFLPFLAPVRQKLYRRKHSECSRSQIFRGWVIVGPPVVPPRPPTVADQKKEHSSHRAGSEPEMLSSSLFIFQMFYRPVVA